MHILEKYVACLSHEISDRAWNDFRLKFDPVNKAIKQLCSEQKINLEIVDSPYGKPFHFYYLCEANKKDVNVIINEKSRLLWKHSEHTERIGDFLEDIVGTIIHDIGYTNVEVRKRSNKGKGIGKLEIDVWGKHPSELFYHNLEVKNRRQPVNSVDIYKLRRKTSKAQAIWGVPVRSALVCSFIYWTARKKAVSASIPYVITGKIFAPHQMAEFYEIYKETFGAYYIEVINDPPSNLVDLIRKYILPVR